MFRPQRAGVTIAALTLLAILLGGTTARADLPYQLPAQWPEFDASTMATSNQAMFLRIAEDAPALLAMNAELLAGDLDQAWTYYSLARNADTALGRGPTLQAIADHDIGALTGQRLTKAKIPADGWAFMQAIEHWQGFRYATCEQELWDLIEQRPAWTPVLNYVLWNCLRARLAPSSEMQACLDRQVTDSTVCCYITSWLISYTSDGPEDLAKLKQHVATGPDVPYVQLLAEMIEVQLKWLANAPSAWELADQWHGLVARYGDLAYDNADAFSYEIISRLPYAQGQSLLAELGRPALGRAFRLRQAENYNNYGHEFEAARILEKVTVSYGPILTLKLSLANSLATGDSLNAVMNTVRQDIIVTNNTLDIQSHYTLLGQKDVWGEVWDELSQEYPLRTINHRLWQLTPERLPALLALRDSLRALDVDQSQFKHQFATLDAATASEVDLAAIVTEPDPHERENLYYLGRITAQFRGDHELRNQLNTAQIKDTSDPATIRRLARSGVIGGDRELAQLALARLDELGDDPMEGLEFRILAARTLEGPAAAKSILTAVNVNMINSVTVLSAVANMANFLELDEVLGKTRARLEALAPASYTAKMVAVTNEEQKGDNAAAVAILRGLAAEYPGSQKIQQKLMEHGESVKTGDEQSSETFDREGLFKPFGDDLDDLESVKARRVADSDTLQSDDIILLSRRSLALSGLDDAYERNRRITQVLTRAGANSWRSFTFTFDPNNGVPHVRCARVLTPDGRVLDTDPDTFLERAPEGGNSDVSDSREMVIPLQGVEPGAIIDIAYDMQNGSYLDNTWSKMEFFLANSPAREYIFELWAPVDHPVYSVVHGDITTVPLDSLTGVRRWLMHDLPVVTDQDNRPSLTEIIPWVGLTTFPDWDAVGRNYGPRFWQTIVESSRLTALADSLTRDADGKREKATALYRYVVEKISPLAVELGAGRLVPSSCDEVLNRGWGDCKDNSHLLVALLQAANIKARPVLVSTIGNINPQENLPSLAAFNHMIVQITGIKGKPYCDPLNGSPCLTPLPAMSAGRLGLHLNPDGSSVLRQITPAQAENHVSDLVVDIQPLGERSLSYEIRGRFTGNIGTYMKNVTAYGDTNVTRAFLDRSVGYGVPAGVPISSWSVTYGDCGSVAIAMTYLDTTWAEEGASSASVHHRNEGSVYWELPPSKDRLYDVIFPASYTAHLVLRLHGNEVWTPADRIVPFSIENDFCHGTIEGKKSKKDGHRLLTINHDFELTRNVIPLDDYENFRRDAVAYAMFSAQSYSFRRVLDKDLIKEIEKYAKQNPTDEGFRLNAAANLLGSDLGGLGEEGEQRRKAAMKLLAPLVDNDSSNSLAAMLVARIHMKRNQYGLAVEVLDRALANSPDDLYMLAASAEANTELERWDIVATNLAIIANKTGNAGLVEQYALALLMLDDEEGAQAQFERMRLLGSPLTAQRKIFLLYLAAEREDDLDGMKQLLTEMEHLSVDEDQLDLVRCSIYSLERRTADTIPILEGLLADSPGSSLLCNNLAWSYAICGQSLERALMLSRVASLLADDSSSERNTYGAVLGRLGKWKEAREIFSDLYENDDRPKERKVNGYFLGLAEIQLGHENKAREIWQTIVDLPSSPKWDHRVHDSLKALDDGTDPAAVMFEG